MVLLDILKKAVDLNASDIFFVVGRPITYKVDNNLILDSDAKLVVADTDNITTELYELAKRDNKRFKESGDDDFSVHRNHPWPGPLLRR